MPICVAEKRTPYLCRMKFVSEDIIDDIADELDLNEEAWLEVLEDFGKAQPAVLAYIFSEDLELLTTEEREYAIYLTIVMWRAIIETIEDELPPVTAEAISEAEEKNWELLETSTARRFRERLDVFFEGFEQEDLLAYIEDALTDDDENPIVTKEGREPMFIALKTIVDVMTAAA